MKRREFITKSAQTGLAIAALGMVACKANTTKALNNHGLFFKLSLAQWSLHRTLEKGVITNLDFAAKAKSLGFEGVEYVNSYFKDKAKDTNYLKEMNSRVATEGIKNVLIMCDGEGNLSGPVEKDRLLAVENHYKWVDAAHFLGCHAIRVNLQGGLNKEDAKQASIDSLSRLGAYAKGSNISVIAENHGGFSSDGKWMTEVFTALKGKNCGTLPDFGNFCVKYGKEGCEVEYNRYEGIQELLQFAKAVSAKSYGFDAQGNEKYMDYFRIMKMVKEVGYTGFVGVEFEGDEVTEDQGITLTRDLLIKVGKSLS